MKLKDTGLTKEQLKEKVNKYMIETYERFDFIAETAKDMYMYDENGTPYLDFYAGIAVNSAGNCNERILFILSIIPIRCHRLCWQKRSVPRSEWTRFSSRTPVPRQMKQ